MLETYILLAVLCGMLFFFISGIYRYDIVAVSGLMILVVLRIVPVNTAFTGFANPAVVTVAGVMIITNAITQSGVVDALVRRLTHFTQSDIMLVCALTFISAILSAFMNNVGALALMMPVAIQAAYKSNRSPSMVLMPLAFSSVLGGMVTAIGTPPNLLISAYREELTGRSFAMFDFTPVGIVIAVISVLFIGLVGWRLTPYERQAPKQLDDLFQIRDYISEVKIPEGSPVIDITRRELEHLIEGDFTIIGLIRNKRKRLAIGAKEILQAKDILIIEAPHDDLQRLLAAGKLELVGSDKISTEGLRGGEISVIEAVIPQGSRLEGRSAQRIRFRSRFNINLLAIARQGKAFKNRLNDVNFRAGDVVLLQGEEEHLQQSALNLGFLPLVERGVQVGIQRRALYPVAIFAIAIVAAAAQIVAVQIAFILAVICLVVFKLLPVRNIYESIDSSVIVLLAAIIPIGAALQSTGATDIIASFFVNITGKTSPYIVVALLLVITMTMSDVMNNAATAVIMAPISVAIAQALHANIDTFLMTVAIGASCSFLTPISHQNNTLVMGPGGYKFHDYLKLGLAVEIIVVIVGIPMILWIWPL